MMTKRLEIVLFAGFTAVFVGYFAIWLPGPAAGLQLMGLEIGEWVKFMGMDTRRNWFYLPPITLGLAMALLTAEWPNGRWQTWAMRTLAVAVSLLAFPAIEDITGAYRSEYLSRIVGIGLTGMTAVVSVAIARKQLTTKAHIALWIVIGSLGIIGFWLPLKAYLEVRPVAAAWMGVSLGYGVGVWLNSLGQLTITAVAIASVNRKRR